MLRGLRSVLEKGAVHRDPLSRVADALEYLWVETGTIQWIGLYLVARQRGELLLGPFFGEVRGPVRFSLDDLPQEAGEIAGEPLDESWYLRRLGGASVRLGAEARLRHESRDRIFLLNLYTGGRWNAQLEAIIPGRTPDFHETCAELRVVLSALVQGVQNRLPQMDLDQPFQGLT